MKKHYIPGLVFALLIAAASAAFVHRVAGAADNPASGATIGQPIANFTLPDVDGNKHSLASLKGSKGTVLIFIAVQCPVSNAYNERMEKLAQDYKARGVNVIGINSNVSEPAADVKRHAAEHNLTFPILKDNDNKIADQLGAEHTPEAYLLDAAGKLVYRGRIDNARNAAMVQTSDLREAIDATIEGKPVTKTTAAAFGCSIKRAS